MDVEQMTVNLYIVLSVVLACVMLLVVIAYFLIRNDSLARDIDVLNRTISKLQEHIRKRDEEGWIATAARRYADMTRTREIDRVLGDANIEPREIAKHARKPSPRS